MNRLDDTAAAIAAILGAAYQARMCTRPVQKLQRQAALRDLANIAAIALAAAEDPEPVLYAIADGLYPFEAGRHDRRRG